MKKRLVSLLWCILAVSFALSGCARNEEKTTQPSINNEKSSEEIQTDAVTLLVWCGSEEEKVLLEEMLDAFKKQNNEIKFNITVAIESEASCKDTLLGDVKNGADVFAFPDDQLMAMIAAGVLEPLVDGDKIKEANLEGSVEAASYDGKIYAYPMTADNGYFMYYNKKYFTDEDVNTLDQMLGVAAKAGKKVMMDWTSGWYIYSFFGGAGLELGLNDDGITNYCNWNGKDGKTKGVDIAKAMLSIANNPGFISSNDDDFIKGVKEGRIIAGINGVWNATVLQEVWGEDYGAVKLPTYTCNENQVQMSSFAGYKMVGVNAYSQYKDWANKLADWITNEENQTLRFERRKQGPSNNNAALSEEVVKSPAIQALIQQSEFAKLQRVGANYWDPVAEYGQALAKGNVNPNKLQSLLDTLVEGITATQIK
ncbi:arabinogalactan oligomer / maltooligosaccharide transport system substrate-binding protein [Anaerosporobacter mobilis DSM 15930]|jgi:arabinogalactan oligomer/maltooligosaccharide transport system substrate-binding protein|uniref:Arabinogalactan oligomer / maltooligosaccharide transport system substrate-binding protein n=1 Tax=Anaerosporobacter mobilis DSM 15930 TaxID=1120996 RepID=A0A1M7LY06_9FIRM|nr:extracellular solute-binding protein [Anaerosporobacter mobilis]SHM82721.1 arabinogalactan oligomer / maltooligosaccharide transport system substrate-binding protein [Anaerosporobacter mobilis DSM 15930]